MGNTAIEDDEQDRLAVMEICSRADRSVSILEKSFIRNGSGRYFVLRSAAAAVTPLSVARSIFLGKDE